MQKTILEEISENAKQSDLDILSYLSLCVSAHKELKAILENDSEFVRRMLIKNCRCKANLMYDLETLKNPVFHDAGCKYRRLFGLETDPCHLNG